MSAIRFTTIDHWTGMKLSVAGTPGMGEVVHLRVENEAVRLVLGMTPDELRVLRDGINKALEHCAKNA